MEKDDKRKIPSLDILKTTANILGGHGKSDEEIKEFLEYHFPISSAIMQRIMDRHGKKPMNKEDGSVRSFEE